eukprot:COSAG02_NODE_38820_length_424_cov_0.981538_1_plen_79_part_10
MLCPVCTVCVLCLAAPSEKRGVRDKVLAPAEPGSSPVDDFQYLSHPDRVTSMQWNGGRGRSALLTCCADGLLRLWVCSR